VGLSALDQHGKGRGSRCPPGRPESEDEMPRREKGEKSKNPPEVVGVSSRWRSLGSVQNWIGSEDMEHSKKEYEIENIVIRQQSH